MTVTTDRDPTMTAAFWAVAVLGLAAGLVALLAYGRGLALGVTLGALLAFSNLWVHSRVVKMYLAGGGPVWAVLGLLKVSLLFGLIYVLVKSDVVEVMPLVVGYGALPLGIAASQLRPAPGPAREER